jgi:hypothetical protein
MENQGAPAVPYLVRALEVSKNIPELNETVGESTHNLACAHAEIADRHGPYSAIGLFSTANPSTPAANSSSAGWV